MKKSGFLAERHRRLHVRLHLRGLSGIAGGRQPAPDGGDQLLIRIHAPANHHVSVP
jgi:hypothetical protein